MVNPDKTQMIMEYG